MSIRASDLPDPIRRQLLDQLRSQLGWSDYDRLVGQLGEDELLNMALSQTQSQAGTTASSSSPSSTRSKKLTQADTILLIFLLVLSVPCYYGMLYGSQGWFPAPHRWWDFVLAVPASLLYPLMAYGIVILPVFQVLTGFWGWVLKNVPGPGFAPPTHPDRVQEQAEVAAAVSIVVLAALIGGIVWLCVWLFN